MKKLEAFVKESILPDFPLKSRVHKANSYFGSHHVFIKRDDELSSGIIGTKLRKYLSLIQYLKNLGKPIAAIGSVHSNNLVSLAQMLIEFDIEYLIIAKESNSNLKGNGIWLKQLVGNKLITIKRACWNDHEKWLRMNYPDYFILPEGASIDASIAGVLTLPVEIDSWIEENGNNLDHLFLDAGTSFTAAVCCAGLIFCTHQPKNIHITHIAGGKELFDLQLDRVYNYLSKKGFKIDKVPLQIHHHFPVTAKSFGSVNNTITQEWKLIMQKEGILLDLPYGAKHFHAIKNLLNHIASPQKCLVVNSGNSFAARNHEHLL
ncbi:MAG: hypothetical protein KDC92_11770 [Bacteroidetes bacterium]|nr:hypothetical protein [Bacteroidota bacterium]